MKYLWKIKLVAVAVCVLVISIAMYTADNTVMFLHKALEKGDFKKAALLNSLLAKEALLRSYRVLKAWEELRDPQTGLVPRGKSAKEAYWNAKDTAADLFPFLLLASHYLDKNSEHLWLNTLSKEQSICGPMPCSIQFEPFKVMEEDLSDIIFGASEYSKDGLLALAERFGQGAWFERLEEIMQAIMNTAYIETKSGKISSVSTEVNGEMLQVLTRLYWKTNNEAYLEMAERIAEVYLFDLLPNNKYLVSNYWDFSKGEPESAYFRLRDHGSEIIAGLAELYLLEKVKGRPKAVLYREPLKKFLDHILVIGRTEEGLWHNTVDIGTEKVIDHGIVDTWGYILNAYKMFDMAEGAAVYDEEIQRTMRSVPTHPFYTWEKNSHDGYADTIESMLYLLPWFDISECHRWVDEEIKKMFHMQLASGFIKNGEYLDGNFIRTAFLYAKYKSQGLTIDPWRTDVFLGAAYDKTKKELYIYLNSDMPWRGIIQFDLPRHQTIWNLPFEYPRLNANPEWFVVNTKENYKVVDLNTGEESLHSGEALAKGLVVDINTKNSPLYLKVSKVLVESLPERQKE
ncbi:MAG: hypothetical protein KJ736_12015 [Candidatus Omnitrophica bacterium]|nr:hypothetical protein [Candidatus Omnitrophota bacterium]